MGMRDVGGADLNQRLSVHVVVHAMILARAIRSIREEEYDAYRQNAGHSDTENGDIFTVYFHT